MSNAKINPVLRKLLIPIAYTILTIGICISFTFAFRSFYFSTIYVDGNSMYPTLVGFRNDADYGIVDKSEIAKKNLKRFQIVTATYPWEKDLVVIKRVLVLPGETFRFHSDGTTNKSLDIYKDGNWVNLEIPFDTVYEGCTKQYPETTLGKDEYIIAGDNWRSSSDCLSVQKPVTYSNLIGVVREMQGRCSFDPVNHTIYDKHPYPIRFFMGVNY